MNFNFVFTPVSCNRGRKWRGQLAYYLGGDVYYGAYGSMSVRLWEPTTQTMVYANPDFTEDRTDMDAAKIEEDRAKYLDHLLTNQLTWCKSKRPEMSEAEVKSFARNTLRKYHPELKEWIDVVLPDNRDVVKEIERTLQWAMTLKTRPCIMYGRVCEGGRPLPEKKKVDIAKSSLAKRGITALEGFETAWNFTLDQMSLPH